jgi:ubiquinone/menaquinone biosynthesis C-methylase UbiE
MKHNDWDEIADEFKDTIFSVFHNDRKGLIAKRIRKLGGPDKTANDLGSGIGHFLPILSKSFGKVLAADISTKCLRRSREKHRRLKNVRFRAADLTNSRIRLPKADLVLCVNSLLMPGLAKRNRALDAVTRSVARGGHLLLVTPSLESSLHASSRLIEWNLRSGMTAAAAVKAGHRNNPKDLLQGIINIDGVPTKHFLKEELVAHLEQRGLRIKEIRRIQYPWTTEFNDPPKWMKKPGPWDWLVVGRKS